MGKGETRKDSKGWRFILCTVIVPCVLQTKMIDANAMPIGQSALGRNYAKIVLPAPPVFYIPSYGYKCNKQDMVCTWSTDADDDPSFTSETIPPWVASPVPAINSFSKPIKLPAPMPFLIPKGNVRRLFEFLLKIKIMLLSKK